MVKHQEKSSEYIHVLFTKNVFLSISILKLSSVHFSSQMLTIDPVLSNHKMEFEQQVDHESLVDKKSVAS